MAIFQRFGNFNWICNLDYAAIEGKIKGPYCISCSGDIAQAGPPSSDEYEYVCTNPNCNRVYKKEKSIRYMRHMVHEAYKARLREGYEVEALDLPPGRVSDSDKEDKNYWISANVGLRLAHVINEITENVRALGPSSYKTYRSRRTI